MHILKIYNYLEKKLGTLKFAVIIITLFSIFMIIGTFLESYYGTEFAGRVIYKSPIFLFLQFLIFLSIFFATMIRLPFKSRLSGFYIIHSGLILIGCGSFITWYSGIDGIIKLSPNESVNQVILNDDLLEISFPNENLLVTRLLPKAIFKTTINEEYKGLKFLDYYPYADLQENWPALKTKNLYSSGKFLIQNKRVTEKFILTLHPEGNEYKSSLKLGPLNIHYFPEELFKCWKETQESGFIIYDKINNNCYSPESKKISIQTTKNGKKFFVIIKDNKIFPFFPHFSSMPLDDQFKPKQNSPYKVFSKSVLKQTPTLLIFRNKISYYKKEWQYKELKLKESTLLPWMGLKLTQIKDTESSFPTLRPASVIPIHKNGSLIKGRLKALKVSYNDKIYWATSDRPALIEGDKRIQIKIGKKAIFLPFKLMLTKFKMDEYKGSKMPSSYESFIELFTEQGPSTHHVYMNNPLKFRNFTFYQSSFFKDRNTGEYSSVLSANIDPGRPIKYAGSILLVLGSIFHYFLGRKKVS